MSCTRIRDRIAAVDGVSILHVTADASHNRSVITFVAPYENMADAAFAAIRAARDHIDLRSHAGVHPRIGAADVVPFIPLDGATMDDCVAIARAVGARVGTELEIPVYLYEHAATRPGRRNLADVRRGGLERHSRRACDRFRSGTGLRSREAASILRRSRHRRASLSSSRSTSSSAAPSNLLRRATSRARFVSRRVACPLSRRSVSKSAAKLRYR